jgi:hypothetical protein
MASINLQVNITHAQALCALGSLRYTLQAAWLGTLDRTTQEAVRAYDANHQRRENLKPVVDILDALANAAKLSELRENERVLTWRDENGVQQFAYLEDLPVPTPPAVPAATAAAVPAPPTLAMEEVSP